MELLSTENGFYLLNEQNQSIMFLQSPDGDIWITSNYQYPNAKTIGQLTLTEYSQKNELVIINIPKACSLYKIFLNFIDDFVLESENKKGVINANSLIFSDDDSEKGAIFKISVQDSIITLIFNTDDEIDHSSLRIRCSGGKYEDNLGPVHQLFNNLKKLASGQARTR